MQEWLVILLRAAALFFLTLVLLRIMGKRQPARMRPFDFVSYTVIALITALISAGLIRNIILGLIALGVWVILPIAIDYLALKSKMVHDWVHGKATVLIKDGKIMEENLMQVRYTGEELLRELRSKNIFNLADVEFAVMETTGDINALLKSDKQWATPHDLGLKVSPKPEPQTVILDGNILTEPLSNLGLTREWLTDQLQRLGVSPVNVFIGQVDETGELYVDLFDDAIQVPRPKVRELVYANIEKSRADLLSFVLDTDDRRAKEMYMKDADRLQQVLEKLKPYLLR